MSDQIRMSKAMDKLANILPCLRTILASRRALPQVNVVTAIFGGSFRSRRREIFTGYNGTIFLLVEQPSAAQRLSARMGCIGGLA
jgi:hypothetical protein